MLKDNLVELKEGEKNSQKLHDKLSNKIKVLRVQITEQRKLQPKTYEYCKLLYNIGVEVEDL